MGYNLHISSFPAKKGDPFNRSIGTKKKGIPPFSTFPYLWEIHHLLRPAKYPIPAPITAPAKPNIPFITTGSRHQGGS